MISSRPEGAHLTAGKENKGYLEKVIFQSAANP